MGAELSRKCVQKSITPAVGNSFIYLARYTYLDSSTPDLETDIDGLRWIEKVDFFLHGCQRRDNLGAYFVYGID